LVSLKLYFFEVEGANIVCSRAASAFNLALIHREELWKAMINFGIPKKYVDMVKLCNAKTMCKVKFLGEISSEFDINSGLRQGDASSPTLFNIGLEKVIRLLTQRQKVETLGNESILAYADDIVIFGNTRQEITQITSKLLEISKKLGLYVNQEKTKFMVLSRSNENQHNLQVGNLTFEKVENFKYLGVNINSKNDMHREISERIASGNRCYHSINKLLKIQITVKKIKNYCIQTIRVQ
jgi:hypothetical protein